jgi:arylsulfatase A-like enzyme
LPEGFSGAYQPADPNAGTFGFLAYPKRDRELALNRYDNALRYVDAQVGRIRDALERRGQLDDTLWVISADHGELFHEHGHVTHGKTLYDREARVPLLLHWPSQLAAADSQVAVSTLDIMPTVLELLRLPPHPAYQGRSFANLRRRAADPSGIYLSLQGLRYGDAVVCWPWKLIHESSHGRLLLYDLEHDPAEQHDLMRREHPRARPLAELLLTQVTRQLAYHADAEAQRTHFAPALLPCEPAHP